MTRALNLAGANGNTYEKITGEAETLDILTFVKEHMENGSVSLFRILFVFCFFFAVVTLHKSLLLDLFH